MKKTLTLLFLALLPLMIHSCSQGGADAPDADTDAAESGPLTFETFSGIPSPLQDCACFFAESNEAFENQQYLFANDNNASGDGTGMAFMQVRDRVRQFSRTSVEKEGDESSVTTYEADGYTLKVISNFGESLPGEAVRTTGTIMLTSPDGETIETEYIGTCSC